MVECTGSNRTIPNHIRPIVLEFDRKTVEDNDRIVAIPSCDDVPINF